MDVTWMARSTRRALAALLLGLASPVLLAQNAPILDKTFFADPVSAGDSVQLRFEILLPESAAGNAVDIAFSDDLDAALTGLVAVGLPATDVCGTGSQLSGTSLLTFSGGSLAPGELCVFEVTVQVPAGAAPGSYPNTTSTITATVDGLPEVGAAASDNLDIAAIGFSKSFVDAPAIAGAPLTLEFTISNEDPVEALTGIGFSDDLEAALTGLVATGLPQNDVCGAGSQLTGTSVLVLDSGNLAAGASCTFSVVLDVPAGAAVGEYLNTTSTLSATLGALPTSRGGAEAGFAVIVPLAFGKDFPDNPASPGDVVSLDFRIDNLHPTRAASAIAFSDDLDATLSGLMAVGLPLNDVCGVGSTLSGTSVLTLTGASLAAGASCDISLQVQVPAGAALGSYPNTTSALAATVDGTSVSVEPASATLELQRVDFSKQFLGPAAAGGSVVLQFDIANPNPDLALADLAFQDDLDAVLPGLVATSTPQADPCGGGSSLSGTGVLALSGGELAAQDSCSFQVTLAVPAGATPGSYPNTTTALLSGGLDVAAAAADTLVIVALPGFAKAFAPTTVGVGQSSTLVFTIDNSANTVALGGLAFSDALPAGMSIAPTPAAASSCGGTVTAPAGGSMLSFAGGSVAAGASCTVQVDVRGDAAGMLDNLSSVLATQVGDVPAAAATLTVVPAPTLSKAFVPDVVAAGAAARLVIGIDNAASSIAADSLTVSDPLPAGLVVANPANASTSCTGGTLSAAPGAGSLQYAGGSVAAGASCTVEVDVAAAAAGSYPNTTSTLSSSLGSSAAASATLTVVDTDLVIAKAFASAPVLRGGQVQLAYTLTNPTGEPATDIAFSDDLGAALAGLAATGTPIADPCGAGSTLSGTSVLSLAGGSLAAGASCVINVSVAVPAAAAVGSYPGATSAVTGTIAAGAVTGNSASATLEVAFLGFSKAFGGTVAAGGEGTLGFTISNPDPVNAATAIAFSDDLEAVLPGLVATGLPQADPCGAGSTLAGTSVVSLAGGNLAGGASCSFSVDIAVPAGTAAGGYANLTSPLSAVVGGNAVAGAPADVASATLTVGAGAPPPLPAPSVVPVDSRGLLLALVLLLGLAGGLGLRMRRG